MKQIADKFGIKDLVREDRRLEHEGRGEAGLRAGEARSAHADARPLSAVTQYKKGSKDREER